MNNQRLETNLPDDQKVLIVMDVFTGQTTSPVVESYEENNICIVNVPANMTKYYQPLDLTVNGYAKRFLKKKINEWYAQQFKKQLDDGVNLEDIRVKLQLTTIEPIHAAWIVNFYTHMTTEKGRDVIESGWRAAGITDALIKGSKDVPSIDPFEHTDPMLNLNLRNPNEEILAACELPAELLELHIDRKRHDP